MISITDHIFLLLFSAFIIFFWCLVRIIIVTPKLKEKDGGREENPHYNLYNKKEFNTGDNIWLR